MKSLTSPHNPRVKHVVKLNQRRYRQERRQTTVEGSREVLRALQCGVIPVEAFVCPSLVRDPEGAAARQLLEGLWTQHRISLWEVTPEVYARLAYRQDSGGLVLVIPFLSTDLDRLPLGTPPFLAVVEGGDKPGNLGAILRTGDAAGVDGVVICHGATGGTDLHNPNVIRASLGTLFRLPVAEATTAVAIDWLKAHKIQMVVATPDGAVPYTQVDYTGPVAVVTGSEAHGLGAAWLAGADVRVRIPMRGMADSLNLAASTAILLYEVVRQREQGSALPRP